MKENELFPSKYVKADDIDGDKTVIISDAVQEAVGPLKTPKLVLYFSNYPKPFICNKTNYSRIKKIYGEDTVAWPGKQITLFRTVTEFQGETIPAIRVREQVVAGNTAAPAAVAVPIQVPVPEEPPYVNDVPF